MHPAVAIHRHARNVAPAAVSAPAPFVAIASRIVTIDRLEVALRGEFAGTLDEAKRHARLLAASVAARFNVSACAELHTHDGVPVYFVECRR